MSRRAQADLVVPRASLRDRRERRRIRMDLYRALGQLGRVDSVERYGVDPPDGPFRDGTVEAPDLDLNAIVRIVGFVTPSRQAH